MIKKSCEKINDYNQAINNHRQINESNGVTCTQTDEPKVNRQKLRDISETTYN